MLDIFFPIFAYMHLSSIAFIFASENIPIKTKADMISERICIVIKIKTNDKLISDDKNKFKTTGVVLKTTKKVINETDFEIKFPDK